MFEVKRKIPPFEEQLADFQRSTADFEATVLLWEALRRQKKAASPEQEYSQAAWERAWEMLQSFSAQYIEEMYSASQGVVNLLLSGIQYREM